MIHHYYCLFQLYYYVDDGVDGVTNELWIRPVGNILQTVYIYTSQLYQLIYI